MKVFQKYYARRLYRSTSLDSVVSVLIPWANDVSRLDSPFMMQVSGYLLRPIGGVLAPRKLKRVMASEICRTMSKEDLEASILLSVVESYRKFDPLKGVDLVTYLSWDVPYQCSKLVSWRDIKHSDWNFSTGDIDGFDFGSRLSIRIRSLCDTLGFSKQLKYYYQRKFNETYS